MELTNQQEKVFLDRYAAKDEDGNPIEYDPQQMWERVANAIGSDAEQQGRFLRLMEGFKFVPAGRILSGAGIESQVTFYNCYVIPIETKARRSVRAGIDIVGVDVPQDFDKGSDSREAIFDTVGLMVDIMSRGGGVGINWSVLRPKGAYLKTINGTTSGPVSWMDVASHAVQTVEQGGSRRGAAMFMLDVWHPDIEEFINAKRDFSKITGANVSIGISNDFMEAVKSDGDWDLVFPVTTDARYNSDWDGNITQWRQSGGPVEVYRTVRARELWRAIAEAAWASGEPGLIFLERYNELSTAGGRERIISVNPCGEQGLGAYSVCNLGAMNLAAYVKTDKSGPYFDYKAFSNDAQDATEFLDSVIDKNYYFIPENEEIQKGLRRIGLGVMGLADALLMLGIRYGSQGAIDFTNKVFANLKAAAVRRSNVLAAQKGPAPLWDVEMLSKPYFRDYLGTPLGGQIMNRGMRNVFLLTQAPTGTTSILAGVNSGIEPFFDVGYWREDRTGKHWVEFKTVTDVKGGAFGLDKYRLANAIVTANEVTVEEHIAMQAAAQRHIDSSVSKTINGPNAHTVEDVERAYTLAYESGLKGVAYFRDGSGRAQVLYREEKDEDDDEEVLASLIPYAVDFKRPATLVGATHKVGTKAGTAYVTVNSDGDGRPVEVFFNVGKAGSDVAALVEALGRLASLALRKGATLGGVANQLSGVGGSSDFNRSVPHAIATALDRHNVPTGGQSSHLDEAGLEELVSGGRDADICPECHNASLVRQEGCMKCAACGFSAC